MPVYVQSIWNFKYGLLFENYLIFSQFIYSIMHVYCVCQIFMAKQLQMYPNHKAFKLEFTCTAAYISFSGNKELIWLLTLATLVIAPASPEFQPDGREDEQGEAEGGRNNAHHHECNDPRKKFSLGANSLIS